MAGILDFSAPLDVRLLDQVVGAMSSSHAADINAAQAVLNQFKEHPDAWQRVDKILETSQSSNTKYFALQILEDLIKYRWKLLPREQCESIKAYVVSLIIKKSVDEATMEREKVYIRKLNVILVQILKQEWPQKWPSFIPDLVGSSKTSETLCENNMIILKLLSEEIFDYSAEQMVSAKVKNLKAQMCGEFSEIFQLCILVLSNATRRSLITATLETLLRFLNWIPLGYIFETNLLQLLCDKFLLAQEFRGVTLKCLAEIAGLNTGNAYDAQFLFLFNSTMVQLLKILPVKLKLSDVFDRANDEEQKFIQDLALFLTAFFREHLQLVEAQARDHVVNGHYYILRISEIDEREVFKVCLEYWIKLVSELYAETAPITNGASIGMFRSELNPQGNLRRQLYAPVLSELRVVMINMMAKPEEVLIVENDEGEIVREFQKDTDSIMLYKSMRECLVYLTHLDYEDMEYIMTAKLGKQIDGSEWSWNNLNKLCWAIGSVSGSMTEEAEKRFLVTVIKELLGLCEMKRGKDNKAVVASNIMYIVGQYPRFLKVHWKFLKTVVNKLFEFMHETHEGVQDMACDTFIKIAQKCRRHFVILQPSESMPFIEEILSSIPSIISELQPQQINTFYEAVGYMIQSQSDMTIQAMLIDKYMELPNNYWSTMIAEAAQNMEVLKNNEKIKALANVLKTNVSACTALGNAYLQQLSHIYMDMLNLYKLVSEMISQAISSGTPHATKMPVVRGMRTIKKEVLRLVDTFVEQCENPKQVAEQFTPVLLEIVLVDFQRGIPQAREPEVLSMVATLVNRLGEHMLDKIPFILETLFQSTLSMINQDFQEFPEHRVGFFKLLRAINNSCFAALLRLPPEQFKLIVDAIVWGFKHTMKDIGEMGVDICHELFGNFARTEPQIAGAFYQSYFLSILQDIFFVLTDREHKAGFKLQTVILAHMFQIVESGQVRAPLWNQQQVANNQTTNQSFLRDYVRNLLSSAFPNLTPQRLQLFIQELFDLNTDLPAFKVAVRDFLIHLQEFASEENQELFLEETEALLNQKKEAALKIPGLVRPMDRPDEMMD